jgi:DnaJ-class molecular chaperone
MKILKKYVGKWMNNYLINRLAEDVPKFSCFDKVKYKEHLIKFNEVLESLNTFFKIEFDKNTLFENFMIFRNLRHADYYELITTKEEYTALFKKSKVENKKLKRTPDLVNRDLHFDIDVKLRDIIKGKKISIKYFQLHKCLSCESEIYKLHCSKCKGSGLLTHNDLIKTCNFCISTISYDSGCTVCFNQLFYYKNKEIELKIGKEFYDGIVYTFPGQGNFGIPENEYGVLKIRPKIIGDCSEDKSVAFKIINESQVETTHLESISKLVLGGTAKIKIPSGECEVFINKLTQPNDYKIIENVGIPLYFDAEDKQMKKGSQLTVFKIKFPEEKFLNRNPEYVSLFKQLKEHENYEEIDGLNNVRHKI